jgi:uncharacterized protein (TIGR03435 family)
MRFGVLSSGLTIVIVAAAVANGQEPIASPQETGPRFDVASVKPNVDKNRSITFRPQPPDGIVLTNNPLESIIRYAFGVQPFRLTGVPTWANEARFDIAAKAAGPISEQQRRQMMRALLADRFQLKAHVEMRERTIYLLTAARPDKRLGRGLTPRPECDVSECESGGGGRQDAIRIRAVTLTQFAQGMLSTVRGELVLDETGIPGKFDVDLTWRPEASTDPDDVRPALVTAIEEQLGLKLQPQRRSIEALVVDSIERPTPD